MNSYLSRIADRATGINKSNAIEPIFHSWPARPNPDNSNPFEKEIGSEPVNPVENTISPAHTTTHTHTLSEPVIEKQNDLKHTPLHRENQKKIHKQINIAPVKDETPINPVPSTKRIIHGQVFTQRVDNKRSMTEPVSREPDKPGLELGKVRQSTVESDVPGLSPGGSKDSQPVTGGVNVPVPELRPVSENAENAVIFTPLKKENKEPRLVIGRIKVEVVKPQPVKAQPAKVRTVTRVKESRANSARHGFHSKIQFGLGQI